MKLHRINHINGSMNMSQILLAVFIATVSLGTPLQAVDLPPELPLWEKPPLDMRFDTMSKSKFDPTRRDLDARPD